MTREEAIEALKNYIHNAKVAGYQKEQYEMVIKALEQEPCEDAISRKDAINAMSNALERVFPEHRDIAETVMNKLPSVSTENSNRLEIKQKCDRINSLASILPYAPHREIQELLCEIMDMSSVSTEKTGRWEWVQYDSNQNIGNWHCSECNRIVCGAITAAKPVYSYKYCPNCGAKMQEVTK